MHYDELHFIPVEDKKETWAAEVLYFCKANSQPLIDPVKAAYKKMVDSGDLDEKAYKALIDPDDKTAEYFTADFKANPIFIHLNNIVDAKIEKIPMSLGVQAEDQYSKTNKWKENERILGRAQMLAHINEFNKLLGYPQLGDSEDPFKYAQSMIDGEDANKSTDMATTMMDSIKSAINDNEDLELFNTYIWKDGVEIAAELGIHYYLFIKNRYKDFSEDILQDIRHHNCAVLRYYTSETTGTPVFDYLDPSTIYTSRFHKNNLQDIIHWHFEMAITFGDFIRMFGASLTKEQLRDAFEKNKDNHGNLDYDKCGFQKRNMATIMIGYMEVESQDLEVYADYVYEGNHKYRKTSVSYQPKPIAVETMSAKRDEKNYNVWRSFYYLPAGISSLNIGTQDFKEQSKYIYKLKKIQDQQRYGDDFRYSRHTLRGWKSKKMSFFDITNAYMPKINLLWQQYQNDVVNAIPHGLVWVEELLTLALTVVDDKKSNPGDLKLDLVKKIKQTGNAISKMLDNEGKVVANGKPFIDVKSGHLNSAMERLNLIMVQYQMMTRALGISEASEGVDPRPRSTTGGLQISQEGTNNSTFYIEKGFLNIQEQCGEALLYYFKKIVEYGDSDRLNEFMDIVGKANGMAMQSIKDIPMHTLGLYVENQMNDEQKALIRQLSNQMAGAGMLDPDIALFMTTIENPKYAYALLRLKMKQRKREMDEQNTIAHQRAMELKQADQQFMMQQQQVVQQEKMDMVKLIKGLDAKLIELESSLKRGDQLAIKDKITDNRIQENLVSDKLERERPAQLPA